MPNFKIFLDACTNKPIASVALNKTLMLDFTDKKMFVRDIATQQEVFRTSTVIHKNTIDGVFYVVTRNSIYAFTTIDEPQITPYNNITWCYECVRDFCGMMYDNLNRGTELQRRNAGLAFYLKNAIREYAKRHEEETLTVANWIFSNFEQESEDYIDYRTGINIKDLVLNTLVNNHKPTDKELAAFLDVVYIDNIDGELECIADYLRKRG